jgi:hypothetical protein
MKNTIGLIYLLSFITTLFLGFLLISEGLEFKIFFLFFFYDINYLSYIYLSRNKYSDGFKVFFMLLNATGLVLVSLQVVLFGDSYFRKVLFVLSFIMLVVQVFFLAVYKKLFHE